MKGKIKIKAFALFYMKAYTCTDNCKSCRIKLGMQTRFSEVRSRVIVSAKIANIITGSLFRANFCRVIFLTLWGFFLLLNQFANRVRESRRALGPASVL